MIGTQRPLVVPLSALVALSALVQTGCIMERTTTRMQVRDPAGVSIASGWSSAGQSQVVVLGASQALTDAVLAGGSFRTGKATSASYDVHVIREQDGSVTFRWADVAMPMGDRQAVVTREGKIEVHGLDPSQAVATGGLGAADLHLRSSGWLTAESDEDGAPIGFKGHLGIAETPSEAAVTVPFTIVTPWSNVVEIRRIDAPQRGVAAILAILSTALFGGVGIPLALSSSKPLAVVGDSLVGIGALIDVLTIPTLLAPSSDERVYPR